MAILEKEVLVPLGNRNIKYYENKGYIIPRTFDERGRFRVKRGTKLLVKIDDIKQGSDVLITKVCDYCGKKIPNQKYDNVIRKRKNNTELDSCRECCGLKISEKRRIVQYENSLEHYNKRAKSPLL